MPGNVPQDEDLLLAQPDDYEVPPLPPVAPQDPAGQAPSGAGGGRDVLRDYFANQRMNRDRLSNAEDTSSSNRFLARMGGAFNTLANAAAPRPADNSAFEQMAKDASNPVDKIERQQKLDQSGDKLLLNYFMSKDRSDALGGYRDKKLGLAEKGLDERTRHNKENEGIGKAGVGIKREGINLRTGAQAAQAAGTFLKDPVMKSTNNQLAQIDKGMGRLSEVLAGKKPFTTTIKADLEKDMANIISGGNSSSLGQLDRIEFKPYVEKWQHKLDQFRGYQGNINAPEYVQQLNDLFSGMKSDIANIQGARARKIKESIGTAYSGNSRATQTIDDNVRGAQPAAPAGKVRVISPKGKPGFIPESQLQEALRAGYTKG